MQTAKFEGKNNKKKKKQLEVELQTCQDKKPLKADAKMLKFPQATRNLKFNLRDHKDGHVTLNSKSCNHFLPAMKDNNDFAVEEQNAGMKKINLKQTEDHTPPQTGKKPKQ